MNELVKTKVHFFSFDDRVRIKNATNLKKFIEAIFKKEKQKLHSINYIFCSDKTLLKINKMYLNHDFFTDVITFELSKKNEPITAEVYISIERVRDNARKMGVSMKSELHRVLFHAVLHLCGYNDKRKKDIELMRKKEDMLLHRYFIPRSRFT
jgi:probable rRNA maturation factor